MEYSDLYADIAERTGGGVIQRSVRIGRRAEADAAPGRVQRTPEPCKGHRHTFLRYGGQQAAAGRAFGKLTAKRPTERRDNGSVVWLCECECGSLAEVSARNLVHSHTTSCGCAKGKIQCAAGTSEYDDYEE